MFAKAFATRCCNNTEIQKIMRRVCVAVRGIVVPAVGSCGPVLSEGTRAGLLLPLPCAYAGRPVPVPCCQPNTARYLIKGAVAGFVACFDCAEGDRRANQLVKPTRPQCTIAAKFPAIANWPKGGDLPWNTKHKLNIGRVGHQTHHHSI